MVSVIIIAVVAVGIGLAVALLRRPLRAFSVLAGALAGGLILYWIGAAISRLSQGAADVSAAASQASPVTVNAAIFIVSTLLGVIGGPLLVLFVGRERRFPVVLGIGFGLLNLSLALSLGQEIDTGLLTLGAGALVFLGLRYLFQGLALGASVLGKEPTPLTLLMLGLVSAGPIAIGALVATLPIKDFVEPLLMSSSAGLFVFTLPFLIGAVREREFIYRQFIGLLAGVVLTATVEIVLAILAA